MAERAFVIENFYANGAGHRGPVITCRKCGTKEYFAPTGQKSSAQKYFQNRGWTLGRSPNMDMCATCQKPDRKQTAKVIKMEPKAPKTEPRTATLEDRKRIREKVAEHYLDNGYEPPWTDKLIAESLKYPVAWIAEVREFAFGPEGSNEALDKLMGDMRAFVETWREIEPFKKQVDALCSMAEEIEAARKKFDKDLLRAKRSS